jgi:hypothetical protein
MSLKNKKASSQDTSTSVASDSSASVNNNLPSSGTLVPATTNTNAFSVLQSHQYLPPRLSYL